MIAPASAAGDASAPGIPADRGRLRVTGMCKSRVTAPNGLLHVAGHVAVEHDPQTQWAVDALHFEEDLIVGNLELDTKVLLLVDVDRLRESERRDRRRLSMRNKAPSLRVRSGASGEEKCGHANHLL